MQLEVVPRSTTEHIWTRPVTVNRQPWSMLLACARRSCPGSITTVRIHKRCNRSCNNTRLLLLSLNKEIRHFVRYVVRVGLVVHVLGLGLVVHVVRLGLVVHSVGLGLVPDVFDWRLWSGSFWAPCSTSESQ